VSSIQGVTLISRVDPSGTPLQATIILEYKLPAATDQDVLGWAQAFHALGDV
jgi:hypothetical protein